MSADLYLNANLVCLRKAVLCANCEMISEGRNARCGACGSQALLRLSGLLGGTIEAELTYTFADPRELATESFGQMASAA